MKGIINQRNILENNLLFKIDLADGTSQLIQIPETQVRTLGLPTGTPTKAIDQKVPPITAPNGDTTRLHPDPVVEASDKLCEEKASHFVYKIIKPEDLNLKPSVKTHLARGRPRKRLKQNGSLEREPDEVEETKKVIKQARTRSGRITKPPKHIEKDFKKIDISDDGKHETDLKTCEFEPLRTNETPSQEPLLESLPQPTRKRNIPSRFRCPTCKKAYLGKIRILNHFQKHPDHRSTSFCKFTHNNTWNFLVLTSQKYKLGPKGVKFCEELEVLLQNARYLAQYLFKPACTDDEGYLVSDDLAFIFGISPGKYRIDETELNRDVTLYEYLEGHDSNSGEIIDSGSKVNGDTADVVADNNEKKAENCVRSENIESTFNTFDYIVTDNQDNVNCTNVDRNGKYDNKNLNVTSKDEMNIDINLTLDRNDSVPDIQFRLPSNSEDIIMGNKEQVKPACVASFINVQAPQSSTSNTNHLALVKYEMQSKPNYLFNNHEFNNINADLHLDNLTNYNNLEIKGKSVFDMENHPKNETDTSQHLSEKQNSHITLQNELRDVDELMLVNVDTGQVSNILDTSSNSDDIMNVDQFVNERFKKLTEPDIDIQNNLLNLELPPLDMFHFHTS